MDGILTEINARFQQKRGMPIAATLEKLVLYAIQSDMSSEHLPNELKLFEKDMDILQLSAQLHMLPDLLLAYNDKNPQTVIKKVTNLRTVCEIFNDITYSKTMFSEVFKLLRLTLTIPVTTATAEKILFYFTPFEDIFTFYNESD